jgi:exosortase
MTDNISALKKIPSATTWLACAGIVLLTLVWNYWATIVDLIKEWRRNQDYSVGQLVPFIVAYLVWSRRKSFRDCRVKPCWWGVGLILSALAVRVYGLLFLLESAQRYSLVLTFAGVVLLLAGSQLFYRARWCLLFLLLMVPLPGRVHNTISYPLQSLATTGAVFFLELFGVTVVREGHVVLLNNRVPITVAEACSGLRMLTAFVVVAATLAALIHRPAWQKNVLVVSSIPIAIVCNLARISATAGLYLKVNDQVAEQFFHDFAGLAMMPLAVLILVGEVYLMKILVVEKKPKSRRRSGRSGRLKSEVP